MKNIQFSNAETVGTAFLRCLRPENLTCVRCFIPKFVNIMTQIPTAQQLIPALSPESGEASDEADANYEYEPDEEEILSELLPRNISVQVFRALLENGASEQGARMSAMDNATRNAGEMIDALTLSYNRSASGPNHQRTD